MTTPATTRTYQTIQGTRPDRNGDNWGKQPLAIYLWPLRTVCTASKRQGQHAVDGTERGSGASGAWRRATNWLCLMPACKSPTFVCALGVPTTTRATWTAQAIKPTTITTTTTKISRRKQQSSAPDSKIPFSQFFNKCYKYSNNFLDPRAETNGKMTLIRWVLIVRPDSNVEKRVKNWISYLSIKEGLTSNWNSTISLLKYGGCEIID